MSLMCPFCGETFADYDLTDCDECGVTFCVHCAQTTDSEDAVCPPCYDREIARIVWRTPPEAYPDERGTFGQ